MSAVVRARLWAAILAAAAAGCGVANRGPGARIEVWVARVVRLEARYHGQQGHRRLAQGDLRGAVRAYQTALAADPGLLALHLPLGYAYERLACQSRPGHPEREEALRRAVVCHRAAARSIPGLRRQALLRLAVLHSPAELDEPRLLESDLQELLDLERPEPDWFLALARLREDAGRIGEAEATLLAAREAVPEAATVHRELARFYRRHQRFDAFFAALERRLEQAPDDREALFALTEGCFYRAFRDHRIGPERRRARVVRGLASASRLLRLEPQHVAAQHYRRLLSRLRDEGEEDGP